jgi:hypothetical protein
MKTGARSLLFAVLALLFVFAWTPVASAIENETYGVTPHPERTKDTDRRSFSIPLETGATFEDAIRIYNNTDEDIKLLVYAADAQIASDDTITVESRDDKARGIGTWIDISRRDVDLGPRGEVTIGFRVSVASSDPSPNLGAVVVENRDRRNTNNVQKLHLLVKTVPPNTPTSSKRVRAFLLRSPWVAIALAGLVVAGALVWVGARRARHPRDVVVEPGALDTADDSDEIQEASRPVIKRLGALEAEGGSRQSVLDRVRASAAASRRRDDRPLLDDALLVEVDDEDEADVDEAETTAARRTVGDTHDPPASATRARREVPSRAKTKKPAPKRKPQSSGAKAKTAKPRPPRRSDAEQRTRRGEPETRTGKKKPAARKKARPAAKKQTPKQAEQNYIPLKDL